MPMLGRKRCGRNCEIYVLVVDSMSSEDNQYCVDLSKCDDATFSFEKPRRDIEDYN